VYVLEALRTEEVDEWFMTACDNDPSAARQFFALIIWKVMLDEKEIWLVDGDEDDLLSAAYFRLEALSAYSKANASVPDTIRASLEAYRKAKDVSALRYDQKLWTMTRQ
jgi:hypothetical protein